MGRRDPRFRAANVFAASLWAVLMLSACAHAPPSAAGSGGGVSLARDWVLDTAEAQPVTGVLMLGAADRRYLKLTGGTENGNVLFSGTFAPSLNSTAIMYFARDISTGVLAGIYANASPSLNFISQGVTSTLAGGSWSINGAYATGQNAAAAFSVSGTGWYDWTGVATGSLATCNAGANGGLQWDTTRNEFVRCNSTAWDPLKSGAYTELLGVIDSDEALWGSPNTSSTILAGAPGMTVARLSTRMAAGVGAGNANIRCTDTATGVNICNCAISCTATGDQTWTCTGGGGTGCTFTGVTEKILCHPIGGACGTNPSSKDIHVWGTRP